MRMKTALLSVWDKTGIVELARFLSESNIAILSSGGTRKVLAEAGIPFTEVSEYTGSPEMMDGRVKTLHPKIHGGLLGRRGGIDEQVMTEQDIGPIDLLVVNLYPPFEEMAKKDLSLPELIEFIDIGGPAMIRSAAKNFRDVAVIIDPSDYSTVMEEMKDGGLSEEDRLHLARKVFARTASYDAAISNYLYGIDCEFPEMYSFQLKNGRELRYGENPHQKAAVYGDSGIAGQTPLQGKQMSYNNYLDADAATGLLHEFDKPAAVIVKHNNPCGVATGDALLSAYLSARDVDPSSAYGSVVALNRIVEDDVAEELASTFVEVVIAPGYTDSARNIMARKENMRVMILPEKETAPAVRTINGGALIQVSPESITDNWRVVSEREPTATEYDAMRMALKVCQHTKSNTIIFANPTATVGIGGAGQMSRVDAAKIAVDKALSSLEGTSVASDAFLPFPDTLEEAAKPVQQH